MHENDTILSVTAPETKESEHVSRFDRFTDVVRRATPAWVVNNGTRINFAIKALADGMSIASSVRRGSQAPARLAANLITLGTLIPGSIYEEKAPTTEERHAQSNLNPMQYVGLKLKQALHPREHVVETVGVATMLNGALTIASGVAQSSRRQLSWELVTGAFTMAAGSALTFMQDRQRAWQTWTGVFLGRMPFKVLQSEQAFSRGYTDKNIRPGDKYQGMNLAMQLVGNVFSTFYAGVKKLPDGTIEHLGAHVPVDSAPRRMAVVDRPRTTLTAVSDHGPVTDAPEPSKAMEVA